MKKLLSIGCFILFTLNIPVFAKEQNPDLEYTTNDLYASVSITSVALDISLSEEATPPDLEDTYKNYFEKRKSAMYYLEHLQASTDFLFYAKKFSKKDFLEKKNEYRTKGGADANVFDMISKQEDFYTTTVPTKTTEMVSAFLESQKDKKDYTKNSAKQAMQAYDLCLQYIEGILLLNPESVAFEALKTKNENEKKELVAYVASGNYEKKLMERTTEQINAVTLSETQMSDIYAEWAVNEVVLYTNIGNTSKVAILSKQWKIIKDNGAPVYKYIDVEASVKGKDNKCYKVTGIVTKAFETDASFGKPVFKYEYKEEMNCDKVSK